MFLKRITLWVVALLIVREGLAQDLNYSLIYATPNAINPAYVGLVEGKMRFNLTHRYRQQTASAAYNSSILTGDLNLNSEKFKGGVGVLFSTDLASYIRTNQMQICAAYDIPLGVKVRYDHLRAGVQLGFAQRHIEDSRLFFEDQYDGDAFSKPTQETSLARFSKANLDISSGITYYRTQKIKGNPEFNPWAGFAVYHINQPHVGFYGFKEDKQSIRFAANFGGKLRTRTPLDLNANILYLRHNNSQLANYTFFARWVFFDKGIWFSHENASIMLGATARSTESIVFFSGFEFDKRLSFAFCFDFVTSKAHLINGNFGGIQLMLHYNIGFRNLDRKTSALPFPTF